MLACIYIWLTHRVLTGLASIPVATFCGLIALVCTAVAGALIDRLIVGILGITALSIGFAVLDLSTSSASFGNVASGCLFILSFQLAVLVGVHWLARWLQTGLANSLTTI